MPSVVCLEVNHSQKHADMEVVEETQKGQIEKNGVELGLSLTHPYSYTLKCKCPGSQQYIRSSTMEGQISGKYRESYSIMTIQMYVNTHTT